MIRFGKLILVFGLLAGLAACAPAVPTPEATQPQPTATSTLAGLPLTDADVTRVSAPEAKAAVEAGEAVIVDVRSGDSYQLEHIPEALSIPLEDIEQAPAVLELDPSKWIITYCT